MWDAAPKRNLLKLYKYWTSFGIMFRTYQGPLLALQILVFLLIYWGLAGLSARLLSHSWIPVKGPCNVSALLMVCVMQELSEMKHAKMFPLCQQTGNVNKSQACHAMMYKLQKWWAYRPDSCPIGQYLWLIGMQQVETGEGNVSALLAVLYNARVERNETRKEIVPTNRICQ